MAFIDYEKAFDSVESLNVYGSTQVTRGKGNIYKGITRYEVGKHCHYKAT